MADEDAGGLSPGPLHMTSIRSRLALALAAWCLALTPALGQQPAAPTNDDCMACHSDAELTGAGGRPVAVNADRFAASIHGQAGIACVDCHRDLAAMTELPHPEKLAPATCGACHEGAVQAYDTGIHAQARAAGGNAIAARCADCHGAHDILPSANPDSRTYHLNLPGTCGACHQNDEMVKQGRIAGSDVSRFQDSIHGVALSRSGLLSAPNCADCHGFHDIKPQSDPSSRVYRATVPETCGNCHEGIERQYTLGIHGTALANGNPIAPSCSTCHSAHGITRTESESWQLQVLSECGGCHVEAIRTYRDTFHGQVTRLGFVRVATCASCHGAHDILPREDARSRVSRERLVETCGTCHPGSNESFVQYDPHADRHNRERNPFLYYASTFMHTLLVGVFLFFGLHTALWFTRTAALRPGRGGPRPGGDEEEGVAEAPGETGAEGPREDGGGQQDAPGGGEAGGGARE
jgi:nitrate/TMAO reductase-like tetraheme cytochrome c subunit